MYYDVYGPRPDAAPRFKAEFRPLPEQRVDDKLAKLYETRQRQVLTSADLWPGWEADGDGFR